MNKKLKSKIKQILLIPQNVRNSFYKKFPQVLGQQIQNDLIQFYRNDKLFNTAVSFNHFIEFFSQIGDVNLIIQVEAHSRSGKSLGFKTFTINSKGAAQFLLSDLFPDLDAFGLFSVSMKLDPKYSQKINYLGKLSPQFMTIYIPQSDLGCPQMIHSHKLKQGRLLFSREFIRNSGHIEVLDGVNRFELFVLNSSKSNLTFKVQISDENSGGVTLERKVNLAAYETACLSFLKSEFTSEFKNLNFKYYYDRPVDHKKPIIFREFQNNSWSCNHT